MKKMVLTEKGKASAGISIYDEGLHQACLEVMKELRWKGPLEFEVMRDKQPNDYSYGSAGATALRSKFLLNATRENRGF